MGLLQGLFGPSKREMWQLLSDRVNGQFVPGGWFGQDKVQVADRHWILTLDTYTESSGQSSQNYTRLRAPYENHNNLRFTVYRKGFFSSIGRIMGLVQDISVGYPQFDHDFIIQGNQPPLVRALFTNERIRHLLERQRTVYFHVADDEGWFGPKFPNGVDELLFRIPGVIKDLDRLEGLFDLFSEVLNHLCHLDPRYDDDISLLTAELLGPPGTIERDGVILWDGDERRRRAAESLLGRNDPQVVPALRRVIDDDDARVRHAAIVGMGTHGDAAVVPGLIRRLGHHEDTSIARSALENLGEGDIAAAFVRSVSGDADGDAILIDRYPAAAYAAFTLLLESPKAMDRAQAARALARMGHFDAVPPIRKALRRTTSRTPNAQAMLKAALEELESRAALPRPVNDRRARQHTLPRGVSAETATEKQLPRPAPEDDGES